MDHSVNSFLNANFNPDNVVSSFDNQDFILDGDQFEAPLGLRPASVKNDGVLGEFSEDQPVNFQELFKCTVCNKDMGTNAKLLRHMKVHMQAKSTREFHCSICGNIYGHRYNLNRHLKRSHKMSAEQIPLALLSPKRDGSTDGFDHVSSLNEGAVGELSCNKPGNSQEDISSLNEGAVGEFSDDKTGDSQEHVSSLNERAVGEFSDNKPGNSQEHVSSLNEGAVGEFSEDQPVNFQELFKCTVCSKDMGTNAKLLRHMKVHLQAKITREFHCSICGNIYGHRRNFKRHLKRSHKMSAEQIHPALISPKRDGSTDGFDHVSSLNEGAVGELSDNKPGNSQEHVSSLNEGAVGEFSDDKPGDSEEHVSSVNERAVGEFSDNLPGNSQEHVSSLNEVDVCEFYMFDY